MYQYVCIKGYFQNTSFGGFWKTTASLNVCLFKILEIKHVMHAFFLHDYPVFILLFVSPNLCVLPSPLCVSPPLVFLTVPIPLCVLPLLCVCIPPVIPTSLSVSTPPLCFCPLCVSFLRMCLSPLGNRPSLIIPLPCLHCLSGRKNCIGGLHNNLEFC